uniref:Uncharacterized protein n=1 Tax=Oryza glumipatula TaxID=40148 RepID=A0A0E0B5W3_9ORYZ
MSFPLLPSFLLPLSLSLISPSFSLLSFTGWHSREDRRRQGGRRRRRGRRAAPLPPAGARRCLASSPADWCAPLSPLPVAGARCCLALSPTGRRAGIPASRHDPAAGIQSRRLPDLEKSKAGGSGTFSSPSCLALASHRCLPRRWFHGSDGSVGGRCDVNAVNIATSSGRKALYPTSAV